MTDDVINSRGAVFFPASAPRAIEMAAEMIANGGLVAIPTDTVYGIAAAWKQIGSLDRIFVAKGRVCTLPPGVDARYLLGIVRNLSDEREGIAIAEELLRARLDARDRMLAPLVHARDATGRTVEPGGGVSTDRSFLWRWPAARRGVRSR